MQAKLEGGNPQMWDYTPNSAADAGDVIVENGIPVVMHHDYDPNDDNATIAPQAAFDGGIYKLEKDGTSGPVFSINDAVYWNVTNGATKTASDYHFGRAVAAAGTNDAYVYVLHRPLVGDEVS